MCLMAVGHSFEESSDLLKRLTGVIVPEKSLEDAVEEEGERVSEVDYLDLISPTPALPPEEIVVVQADDAHVLTVDDDNKWREAKSGLVYVLGREDEQRPLYACHIGGPEKLGENLREMAAQVGLRDTSCSAFLGDGAPWIWNLARRYFPGTTEILDFYHLSENVNYCRAEIFGEDSKIGKNWTRQLLHVAKHQGGERAIKRLENSKYFEHEALQKLLQYMRRNRTRIDYSAFKAMGLPIGSGRMESACKRIVTTRLKGSGMRWTIPDAQKIANLRCLWLGQAWDEYWAKRKKTA